jgi:hypothetical protein
MRMLNKRAQVGETITWIVGTLIIVVVLIAFVYVSSLLSKAKVVTFSSEKIEGKLIEQKIFFADTLSKDKNKEAIHVWIDNKKNVNE